MNKGLFMQCAKIITIINYCTTFHIVTVLKPIQMKILSGQCLFCMLTVYFFSAPIKVNIHFTVLIFDCLKTSDLSHYF